MKNRLVVVTDLGMFKAYRLEKDSFSSSPRLELIENYETPAEEKLSHLVTDQAGRFSKRTGAAGVGTDHANGERHNIRLEQERRIIKQLAEKLSVWLNSNDFESCYFAANKEINRQILDHLSPSVRAKIERNVAADLTKTDKSDLLRHF